MVTEKPSCRVASAAQSCFCFTMRARAHVGRPQKAVWPTGLQLLGRSWTESGLTLLKEHEPVQFGKLTDFPVSGFVRWKTSGGSGGGT